MDAYLNYFVEANLGLSLLALLYLVFLKNETDFRLKRKVLLVGILCSLLFPLLHFQNQTVASLQEVVPTIWLPEFRFEAGQSADPVTSGQTGAWTIANGIYCAGVAVFLCMFVNQIFRMARLIRRLPTVNRGSLLIAEADHSYPSFSFFNFVVIGSAESLNEKEKRQIISHETIHARQYHSLDIMVVNILQIFFWCNPVIHLYKNIFIQLHEFEADSRAVDDQSLDDYCSLLARVALMSADLRIANHFSNSLTLKRIQMMRKIKFRTKPWKLVAMATVLPVFFVGVACNDEVAAEISSMAQETQMALDVPAHVQERYDLLSAAYPDKKYILLEMAGTNDGKLKELENKFGLPVSIEVFKNGQESLVGKSEAGVIIERGQVADKSMAKTFAILEYNTSAQALSNLSSQGNVFTIVEKTATPRDGMPGLYKFLSDEVSYPDEARKQGVEGKVFVEFIVETDGSISNVTVKKGVHAAIDAEAIRVMSLSPKWTPGSQKGVAVRQKMIIPINFSLGNDNGLKKTSSLHEILNPIPPIKPKNDRC